MIQGSMNKINDKSLRILIFPLKWTGLLWLLQLTTKLIGNKGRHGSVLSREDFSAMTEIAEDEGLFEKSESKIIKNLLSFKNVTVKDIMTPRTVMKTEDASRTIADFFSENSNLRFSRIPVYIDDPDNIIGLVLKDDVFLKVLNIALS